MLNSCHNTIWTSTLKYDKMNKFFANVAKYHQISTIKQNIYAITYIPQLFTCCCMLLLPLFLLLIVIAITIVANSKFLALIATISSV